MKEGYIGGPTGGVPETIFRRNFGKNPVKGASGAELFCEVRERKIEVRSTEESYKWTRFFGQVSYDGILGLNILNRGIFNNQPRHPDVYAAKLVERFVEFTGDNGYPVSAIDGRWLESGMNSKTFRNYLDTIAQEREISPQDELDAARMTWTGALAHRLGYANTEVIDNGRQSNVVWARFRRS
jgi:hypothetical protein